MTKKKGDPRNVTAHPAGEGGAGGHDDSEISEGAVWGPSETTVVHEKRTTSSGGVAASGSHWGGGTGGAYNYVPPPDPGYSSETSSGVSQSSGGTTSETGGGDTTTVYETRTPTSEHPPAAPGALTLGPHIWAYAETMVVHETRAKESIDYDPLTGHFRILFHDVPVYETRTSVKFEDGDLQTSRIRHRRLTRSEYDFENRVGGGNRQATKKCVPTRFEIGPAHVDVAVIIGAFITASDGYVISNVEAGDQAYHAATYAANVVAYELTYGGMHPRFAQEVFMAVLLGFLRAKFKTPTGDSKGWTVDGCFYIP
ncbi:hypothetical protein ACH4C6_32720 [Streptomyces sp. NPDC017943]|uniref:hypothetical protein n=1 Tax=Streptomyces sp. NPDC017943 TaxID=3365019 RepID=UPI00379AD7A0